MLLQIGLDIPQLGGNLGQSKIELHFWNLTTERMSSARGHVATSRAPPPGRSSSAARRRATGRLAAEKSVRRPVVAGSSNSRDLVYLAFPIVRSPLPRLLALREEA